MTASPRRFASSVRATPVQRWRLHVSEWGKNSPLRASGLLPGSTGWTLSRGQGLLRRRCAAVRVRPRRPRTDEPVAAVTDQLRRDVAADDAAIVGFVHGTASCFPRSPPQRDMTCHGLLLCGLPPRYLVCAFLASTRSLTHCHRHEVATGGPDVELPRSSNLLLGVRDHLLPLGEPAGRAGNGEQDGKHLDR